MVESVPVNDYVVDRFIKLVEPAAIVKRDDRHFPATPGPFVSKRGNDTLNATSIETVGYQDYFGAEIDPTGVSHKTQSTTLEVFLGRS